MIGKNNKILIDYEPSSKDLKPFRMEGIFLEEDDDSIKIYDLLKKRPVVILKKRIIKLIIEDDCTEESLKKKLKDEGYEFEGVKNIG